MEKIYNSIKIYLFNAIQQYTTSNKEISLIISPLKLQFISIKNNKEKVYNINNILRYKEKEDFVLSLLFINNKKKYYKFKNIDDRNKFISLLCDTQYFFQTAKSIYGEIIERYNGLNQDTLTVILNKNNIEIDSERVKKYIVFNI